MSDTSFHFNVVKVTDIKNEHGVLPWAQASTPEANKVGQRYFYLCEIEMENCLKINSLQLVEFSHSSTCSVLSTGVLIHMTMNLHLVKRNEQGIMAQKYFDLFTQLTKLQKGFFY